MEKTQSQELFFFSASFGEFRNKSKESLLIGMTALRAGVKVMLSHHNRGNTIVNAVSKLHELLSSLMPVNKSILSKRFVDNFLRGLHNTHTNVWNDDIFKNIIGAPYVTDVLDVLIMLEDLIKHDKVFSIADKELYDLVRADVRSWIEKLVDKLIYNELRFSRGRGRRPTTALAKSMEDHTSEYQAAMGRMGVVDHEGPHHYE